jgi:hypothetical protein
MRQLKSPIRLLALASVLVLASSCGDKPRPSVGLNPPADLLTHSAEPAMTEEALTSEEAYERQRDAKIEWGRENASIIDRACWWMQDAGVKGLTCAKRP